MPKPKMVVFGVQLSPYFKSGDDFGEHLKAAKGKIPKALEAWATQLEIGAQALRVVAHMIRTSRGEDFSADGDTHRAAIAMSEPLARKIVSVAGAVASLDEADEEDLA